MILTEDDEHSFKKAKTSGGISETIPFSYFCTYNGANEMRDSIYGTAGQGTR